jgi:uncharacterized repeat protein (TIGR02543 family)
LDGYSGTGAYTVNISVPASTYYTLSYSANGGAGAPEQQNNPTHVSTSIPTVPKAYTITYNSNGGSSIIPGNKQVQCTFRNWNTNVYGTGTVYEPGAPYLSGAFEVLHAQWNNPAAGELPTPTRDGYDFKGWFTAATDGTQVTSATVITWNLTIFAQWKYINTSTAVFNANGGTGTMDNQIFMSNVWQALNANAFTRAGYTFLGWSLSPTGLPTYKDQEMLSTAISMILYAVWDDYGGNPDEAYDWLLTPGVNSITGTLDFFSYLLPDRDILKFTAITTGTYIISASYQAQSAGEMTIQINDKLKTLSGGTVSFECDLVAGEVYYIVVYNTDTTGTYTINITVPQ